MPRFLIRWIGAMALSLSWSGCVHQIPLSQIDADEPQYHPQPPIYNPQGKPIRPPAFYDGHDQLAEAMIDPELRAWLWFTETNMAAGHTEYSDAVQYVKGFDRLLAKHPGDKSVATEQILRAKAYFYRDVWDDETNADRLFHQLMREYPDTPFGKKLLQAHQGHKSDPEFDKPVDPLE
jgi:hypothetical protein